MTYRLLAFSEEKEDFVMEIIASPSTSFLELHNIILNACNHTELSGQVFLICDENWKIKQKIHLEETSSIGYDEDINLMKTSLLDDFIEEEGQHLAYVYEPSTKKTLLIELIENRFGEKAKSAYVSRSKGAPPSQFEYCHAEQQQHIAPKAPTTDTHSEEEYPYNEENFSEEEIDMEGFEVSEM